MLLRVMAKQKSFTMKQMGWEPKLLAKLKKITGWNSSMIIREALKMFAAAKGVE